MSDINKKDEEEPVLDKKALKAQKKEEQKKKKQDKKKKGKAGDEEFLEEESGGGFAVVLVTLVIIIVWLAILALLVKMDVGGFGSTVLKPILKDVPYVNKILPDSSETADAISTENTEYPYSNLNEAIARIKELEKQIQEQQDASTASTAQIADLQQQADQLAQYKANEAAFEAEKKKFDEEVVFSDKAPDISQYKTYYESINPENADAIYKQVVEQTQKDAKLEDYVSMYSNMKADKAAAIFNTMTNDLNLVASILQAMDPEQSSAILGAMNTDTAAKLTKIMNPGK